MYKKNIGDNIKMTEPTTVQYVFVSLAVISVTTFLCFYLWIDYKREKDLKKNKASIIFQALLAWGIIIGIVITAEFFGVFSDGWNERNKWIWPVSGALVFLIFYRIYKSGLPKEVEEIYQKYALTKIKQIYNASPYIGEADMDPLIWLQRVTQLNQEGIPTGQIHDHFLVQVQSRIIFKILITLDAFTGRLIFLLKNPSEPLINRLLEEKPNEPFKGMKSSLLTGESNAT